MKKLASTASDAFVNGGEQPANNKTYDDLSNDVPICLKKGEKDYANDIQQLYEKINDLKPIAPHQNNASIKPGFHIIVRVPATVCDCLRRSPAP